MITNESTQETTLVCCPGCSHFLSSSEYKRVRSNLDDIFCPDCGQQWYATAMMISLAHGQESYLDDNFARSSYWYHATYHENWLDSLEENPNGVMVHVGSLEAAQDRAIWRNKARFDAPDYVFIYKLALDKDTVFSNELFGDHKINTLPASPGFVSRRYKSHALRYTNAIEHLGSISLFVDHRRLRLVDCWEITS